MIKLVAGVEVGIIKGVITVNPNREEMNGSPLHLTLAGTKDEILMIEGLSNFLPEDTMIEALTVGHKAIGEICDALVEFQKVAGRSKKLDTLHHSPSDLVDKMDQVISVNMSLSSEYTNYKLIVIVVW
jgi:polyribonucleotide nucleotidyltransferase